MAPRVVVFSCQWSPHYGFQSLYRRGRRGEGDALRVLTTCVGRVGEDVVLEAFRQGAASVWVLACTAASCRHGLARDRFAARIAATRAVLATLGIDPELLVVREVEPHEGSRVAEELGELAASLEAGA